MGDIVVFTQENGPERCWVPRSEEEWWIRWWGRGGVPAARWKDYLRWGHQFYPPPTAHDIGGRKVLHRPKRKRTNYARWKPPE